MPRVRFLASTASIAPRKFYGGSAVQRDSGTVLAAACHRRGAGGPGVAAAGAGCMVLAASLALERPGRHGWIRDCTQSAVGPPSLGLSALNPSRSSSPPYSKPNRRGDSQSHRSIALLWNHSLRFVPGAPM